MTHTPQAAKIPWGLEQRLEFIEFRAFWDGGINRADITQRFGVSVPQASSDLAVYRDMAPENLTYDASAKRYVAAPDFRPVFREPAAERYLSQLRAAAEGLALKDDIWIKFGPFAEAMPVPGRRVDTAVLRRLLAVMRQGLSVEVRYHSMSAERPDGLWRRITPHAFVSDGLRWHVRGYCHLDDNYKDFILSRWRALRSEGAPGHGAGDDRDWNETFAVELRPNPSLSTSQQEAVAWEYDMPTGSLTLTVRKALLYYLKRRLRLDVETDRPAETPVVIANRAHFDEAQASARGNVMTSCDECRQRGGPAL